MRIDPFNLLIFALSIVASFLFGYMLFRYEIAYECKAPIEVVDDLRFLSD